MEIRPLSTLIIRDLIFTVLKDKEFCRLHSKGYDFFNASGGTEYNLFHLVERRAIEKNLIDEQIKVSVSAWGVHGDNLFENHNTNFTKVEIERFWESFYLLLNSNVIAPGMYRNSSSLPYFHVTGHGEECLQANEILPYDIDGYLKKLKEIPSLNEWVEFYITEALKCYNVGCYNSATMMIGLSSEHLIELLIFEFSKLLGKTTHEISFKSNSSHHIPHGKTLKEYFDEKTQQIMKISTRYEFFNEVILPNLQNLPREIMDLLDRPSRRSFGDYLRLTRNEVSHPNEVKREPTETMLLFIGFVTYCSAITNMINIIKAI
ncbi:hypothetical protein [Paenibacillus sp. Marseille-Q9583]